MTTCYPSTARWTPPTMPEGGNQEQWDADIALAELLAWSQLQALLGYSLAICPIEVRPCRQGCVEPVYRTAPIAGGSFAPTLIGGAWVNSCGCVDACSCGAPSTVSLPGPVGRIDSVTIDGTPLPKTAYAVYDGVILVRQDGEAWPACQDLSVPLGQPGTWSVRYFRGDAPSELDDWAAGVLAEEFFKAGHGDKKCRLPAATQQVVRNGVTLDLRTNLFLDGSTGIREIDMLISQRNPHRLTQPSRVKSPDSRGGRIPTWRR